MLGMRRALPILVIAALAAPTAQGPAQAALLSTVVGGVTGTATSLVGGVLSVVTSGWDDNASTPPVALSTAAASIGADQMQANGIDGEGVGIAMIDTGVVPVLGLTEPGQVVNGPDLSFESQSDTMRYLDGFGHGTHMAGIIAGNDGAAGSFRGIAPGAKLISMRVGAHDGAVDVTQVIAAIDWAVQHKDDPGLNIRVINLSYGTDGTQDARFDPLSHAIEVAWRNGITVVVGGGNDGTDRTMLVNPATNPYVIAVGAADIHNTPTIADDTVAPFSSRGSSSRSVDLVAPGVSIASLRDPGSTIDSEHPSAVVNERFFRGSGTSQAAAVTSGAVALLLSARPSLTPDQVKSLLRSTATPVPNASSRAQGAGRLNVAGASIAPTPLGSQSWNRSYGTGSVEKARGTSHVADGDVELTGEKDIFGKAWQGSVWAPAATARTTWSGGTWNGSDWTGTCWCTLTWSGFSWTGRQWTGTSWTGRSWTGRQWTGRQWTGRQWTDGNWTGRSWTGRSWTGRSWS